MSEPLQLHGNTLHIDYWEERIPGLTSGFTSRMEGVSEAPFHSWNMGLHVGDQIETVIHNRERLANKLEMPLGSFTSGEQVHGTLVKQIGQRDKGCGARQLETSLKGVDGMITKEHGIMCTAFFADCVPLFFLDPVTGFIGVAHAGWKGTVGRMAEEMVLKLTAAGARKANIQVVIGPCISKAHYEVDDNVISHLSTKEKMNTASALANGHYLLDLKKLNAQILLDSGLPKENVAITSYCTFENNALFFSHRRDQGKTGRMLAFIGYR